MNKFLAGIIVALLATSPAIAAEGPYAGVSGGLSMLHDSDVTVQGFSGTGTIEYEPGFGFTVAAGYNFEPVRLEGEFGYRMADVDNVSGINADGLDLSVMSFMINGYYDVKADSIKPFFGLGLGLLNGELEYQGDSEDDTTFGYQLTAGVAFPISDRVFLDMSYRYQGSISDFENNGVEIDYGSSNIYLGFRFGF